MNQLNAAREYETAEQRKLRIKRVFDSFDTDKNGTIDRNEFINGLSMLFQIENLDTADTYKTFFNTIFNMCDKAGWFWRKDGVLDQKEFIKIADAIPLILTHDIKTNLGTMLFNIIDDDRSGQIERKEMANFLKYSDFSKTVLAEHPFHELIHPAKTIDHIDIGETASHERNI